MTRRGLFTGTAEAAGFQSRKPPDADLDITPMIDCVFLLLIFFMVSSTMRGNVDDKVPQAEHGLGVDARGIITVRIVEADPSPRIMLGNRESSVDEVKTFVEEGRARGLELVVIKADREVPHGFVQSVARVVNDVEGVKFSIGVQDKKQKH